MTSVRSCYCKQEENVSRKKNDVITDRDQHLPTAASKRLIVENKVCRSSRESPIRERSDEKMTQIRSVEVQSNPVLSPETSTALENAEKIINNAKIQLMEVCAMSNLDSGNQNKNTCSNLPLDDETEELMYIRELVASKFYEANISRSEANDKTSARLESPRVTVPRVDLSAPKFRMSRRRRRAYCQNLEYGNDDRSRERASPARVPSRDDSSSSKNSNDEENEVTMRDDRTRNLPGRTSSATGRELVHARENTCEIQIGPSVHIVDRELTRQDLDDVHISPESTWCCTNTATYILHHLDAVESPITSTDNEFRKISEAPRKTLRVRLDTSHHEGPIIAEAISEATNACVTTIVSEKSVGDMKDSEQDNERIESFKSQVQIQNCIDGEEKKEIDIEDAKISECLENATNQEVIHPIVIDNSGIDNERLQDKPRNKNNVKIIFRNNVDYAEEGRILNKNSDVDGQAHIQKEESTDVQEENRSKPLPDNDASRKTGFPHRGNIALQTYRAMESSRLYRTQIDGCFSNIFDSHNGQDKVYDIADKDVHHRSFLSNCMDDFRIIDNLSEIDLYRPCLNDLDTILLSNDRKIERVVHAAENFTQLLSRLEFAKYKDEDEQTPRYVSHEEFHHESSTDKDRRLILNEPSRSLIFETELKNTDLTVSCVPSEMMRETNKNSQGTATDTIGIKSSSLTKESDSRSKHSKNSVESSMFPASDMSYESEISRDKIQRPRDKAHLSESSIYKSDITTFSNIASALCSTRTEIQTYGEKHITQNNHQADAERHVTSANRLSKREIGFSQREYSDNVFAQAPRKDTTEAADRLIAYILQDEKQSIEKKVADALKESTIAPVAVQKFLDNLRNVESTRNTRQTETLDILKNILINVQNQTDRETKESVPLAARSESIQHSKDNSERDTCQTGNVDFAKVTDKSQTYKKVKDAETFPGNIADTSTRMNAIEESILQTQGKDNANDIGQIGKKSHDFKKSSDKVSPDSSACRETRKDVVHSMAFLESPQSSKNNSKGNSYSEAESLKQISDIRSDDDILPRKSSENPSTRTVSVKSNEDCMIEINDPVGMIVVSAENKEDDMSNERRGDESSNVQNKIVPQKVVKEIIIEETHDNITVNQNISPAKILKIKDERIHLDANSAESVDEILENENVSLVQSSTKKESLKSLCTSEKNIASQHSVVEEQVGLVASSCSADSLRDHTLLTCAKNSELSIKEVGSHIEQNIITRENDLIKDTKDDEIHDKSMTIIAVDNHRDAIEDLEFLKNTKSNNEEQLNDLQKYKIDILSSSNSSSNSTLLDYDNRSTNDTSNAKSKRVETSSETSHSEGELYMPSSCSYSLGEVRVLKKRELISDNSIDHDSATILVTRSMLTSLSDSPVSLLTNSGCI
ncbi:uncharacterized protein LOC126859433 [Cataglyphis hispanica]|uniref:uncharacterized protein LOC126859433 n=1 Tax=Cataglyphis hispanica TaxID=1086592 RepID=UPI0021803257|nr:uncharacterized protein LOC126859433 [Cataglyphis hispanica]